MPEWTWRRHFAHYSTRDHQGEELDAEAMEAAREEFAAQTGVDADALDEEKFLRWLDDPIPDDHGAVEDLFEWWLTEEGPLAHAAQIIDLLGVVTPDGYDGGIYIDDLPPLFGGAMVVGEQGLDRLKNAIAARGLPIEIIETR